MVGPSIIAGRALVPAHRRSARPGDQHEVGQRIDATLPPRQIVAMGGMDALLAEESDALDRLCGYAVRCLEVAVTKAVLDLLGVLEDERFYGIYYALPNDKRRRVIATDPTWGYRVNRCPEGVDAELECFAYLASEFAPQFEDDGALAYQREYRRYCKGLGHSLSAEEVERIESFKRRQRECHEKLDAACRAFKAGKPLDDVVDEIRESGLFELVGLRP